MKTIGRTFIAAAALADAIATGIAARGQADARDDVGAANRTYAVGLWGDLPYSTLQATVGVPNLIADMNAQNLAFTVHDGDLKAGSNTPGDNDWTDCDRPSNGGFSSLERLDYERSVFFSTPFSLGGRPMRQQVQTAPMCLGVSGFVPCVENRRWSVRRVVYATMNVQGSCNNLCDTAPDPAEWAARNLANITWMRDTFEEAGRAGAVAIMFITQADPGWDLSDATRAPLRDPRTRAETDGQPDGYADFLGALRQEVINFGKPVAYVHGDSHYFRLDKPFLDTAGRRLENFTRVETFGDNQGNGNNDVHWLKVLVDPESREVFAYQPQIVPANRTAVPQP